MQHTSIVIAGFDHEAVRIVILVDRFVCQCGFSAKQADELYSHVQHVHQQEEVSIGGEEA